MAPSRSIPPDVREQVIRLVEQFNAARRASASGELPPRLLNLFRRAARTEDETKPAVGDYVPRFQGRYLYLDRAGSGGRLSEICRLTWTGDMHGWEFAIYKHSRNRYDPDEWFFPGAEEVDGTVEGAMRAGLAAYPE
jgi:hypothetical protein